MEEFNALEEQAPLTGNIFIEASAGTGKTFAIEHIVVRLLKQNIPLDQILLTTFTNKGVRDLKRRIHLRLLQEAKREPSLALKNGLRLMDRAEIHTIHSFCYKMQQEYAFEAGLPLASPSDPVKERVQRERLILDTLRVSIHQEEFSPGQLLQLLRPFGKNIARFLKKMTTFLSTNPTLPSIPSFKELLEKFSSIISADELFALPEVFKKMNGLVTAYDLETLLTTTPPLYDLLVPENLKKGASFPAKADALCSLLKEAAHPTFLFFRMARKIQERERPDIPAPHRLLETMHRAIEKAPFREAVRARYQAVVIDEFQDTDPLQWQILHSLYYNHAALFLVVGDPKQSIYAFRGGDLPTFLNAKTFFEKIYSLSTNYRSPPALLEGLNQLFNAPGLFEEITYLPLRSGKAVDYAHGGLFFFLFPRPDEELLFSLIAFEIDRLKKEAGISYDSFAILLKDRYQIERLLGFLQQRGFPALSLQQQSLVETPLFSLFEIVFKVLYQRHNFSLLKQFVLHPLIGWEKERVASFLEDPEAIALLSSFDELHRMFHHEGLVPFLSRFLHLFPLPCPSDTTKMVSLLIDSPTLPTPAFFEELRKRDTLGDPAIARLPLTAKGAIQVLTTHMSKGLEFDYVFALGTSTRSLHEEMLSSYAELDKEKLRLLYVALTRAKKRISVLLPLEEKPAATGGASPLELLLAKRLQAPLQRENIVQLLDSLQIEHSFVETVPKVSHELPQEAQVEENLSPFPDLPPPQEILSFSQMTPHFSLDLPAPKDDPLPRGKEVGILLHALLEKWIEEGVYFFTPKEKWRHKISSFLYATPLEGYTEEVFALVDAAFHTPLDGFCLREIPPERMLQEVEFSYTFTANALLKGYADLVFSQGYFLYLLDWKFHALQSYDQETLAKVMTEGHYHRQKELYAEGITRYFHGAPLKKVFYFFLRGKEKGLLLLE